MAKRTSNKKPKKKSSNPTPKATKRVAIGLSLICIGLILSLSFISYFFSWQQDQSVVSELANREVPAQNLFSKIGAFLGDLFVRRGFGLAMLIPAFLLMLTGVKIALRLKISLLNRWLYGVCWMTFFSVTLGFFSAEKSILGGMVGFEVNRYLQDYLGVTGVVILLVFVFLVYLIYKLNITPEKLNETYQSSKGRLKTWNITDTKKDKKISQPVANMTAVEEVEDDWVLPREQPSTTTAEEDTEDDGEFFVIKTAEEDEPLDKYYTHKSEIPTVDGKPIEQEKADIDLQVEKRDDEELTDELAQRLVDDFGEFDPKLELSNYRFPTLDLLNQPKNSGIVISEKELQDNKDNIVQTLKHYGIDISNIKATVGPTVTLYEIVPAKGVRISKIKNLEDDIALSLAALGIRIIAPIPGKGTVGIEVPNKNPSVVFMSSMIGSKKFQEAEMELPIAFGKTISNESFVVDLAKMPHMLMAGATGQGKSVGLNVVLTSLLYKKHPAEVKFVLVDPKKVELTLFNKIERHYLAKLPDTDEAIITDNAKVINTLNSLCIEMDDRYALLQDAMVRNIKEYNQKFKSRKLNPNDGHRFLPYIVLVVDEFADLIMTAGKEVEHPIARLAQLARAIGIHLIIATQRPSVNVLTGMIKANFPARVAFRVFSKIDSRTILDANGADQLIGKGDMLFTQGSELVRLQCAFVDTPEVSHITDFIGNQRAYPDAYLLPEYVGEGGESSLDIDPSDRDALFREAAEVIVTAQQGSASLLQRKLKLGYNRAGRLIDQLEAAGIVGPFEGSKARQVLVDDLTHLDQLLNGE